jgi:hypothetical protein
MSYLRVVRFTDVDPDTLGSRLEAREESGPPEGSKAKSIKMIHDPDQRTAVVIQSFDSEQDMKDSEAAFDSMPAEGTPGTRASVDRGEVKFERDL